MLIPQVYELIYGVVGALTSSELLGTLLKAAIPIVTALADGFFAAAPIVYEQLPEIIDQLVMTIVDSAPELWEAGKELLVHLKDGAVEVFPQLLEAMGNLLHLEDIADIGSDIGNWFKDGIASTIEKIKQTASDIVTGIMEWLDTLPERMGEMLGEALGNIAKWAVEAPEKAWNGAKLLVSNVREFMQKLPSLAKEHLDNTIEKVKAWASQLVSKGKTAAQELVSAIDTTIKELPQKMLQAGTNLVQGLWDGITGMGDWLRGKISDFGSGIINGFKESFGIHSPSTVMRDQVGVFLAEGVGVGFVDGLAKVGREAVTAMEQLTDDIVPDFPAPRPPRFPRIDSTAYQAFSGGITGINSSIAPQSTSEIVNNYSYSTTNSTQSETTQSITINAQLVVGEEIPCTCTHGNNTLYQTVKCC